MGLAPGRNTQSGFLMPHLPSPTAPCESGNPKGFCTLLGSPFLECLLPGHTPISCLLSVLGELETRLWAEPEARGVLVSVTGCKQGPLSFFGPGPLGFLYSTRVH